MKPANTSKQYYPALDGLRGVAILLVILYHNFSFIPYFNYGWLGVDLFFVLSGFLITDILLNARNTRNYFKNFYARRILRIFPLYYLALLLFIVIFPLINNFPLDLSYYKENQLWFWTYLQNWVLIFHRNGTSTALNHFWSLAVEEQYYILWPFIILLIKKPKWLLGFCLLVLTVIISARIYIWNNRSEFPTYQWLFLFTRIDGLLIGSMLAVVYQTHPNLLRRYSTAFIFLLAGFNFALYFLNKDPDFPVWSIAGYITFAAIFALLVYESVKRENKFINLIFTNSVLQFLGKYSYGFYIFHWPVFLLAKPYSDKLSNNMFSPGSLSNMITSAILATIAGLLISFLSYHLYEKHFLNLKKHFN